jgi:hypothetical protein
VVWVGVNATRDFLKSPQSRLGGERSASPSETLARQLRRPADGCTPSEASAVTAVPRPCRMPLYACHARPRVQTNCVVLCSSSAAKLAGCASGIVCVHTGTQLPSHSTVTSRNPPSESPRGLPARHCREASMTWPLRRRQSRRAHTRRRHAARRICRRTLLSFLQCAGCSTITQPNPSLSCVNTRTTHQHSPGRDHLARPVISQPYRQSSSSSGES